VSYYETIVRTIMALYIICQGNYILKWTSLDRLEQKELLPPRLQSNEWDLCT